jgi:hypothetical protein
MLVEVVELLEEAAIDVGVACVETGDEGVTGAENEIETRVEGGGNATIDLVPEHDDARVNLGGNRERN